MNSWTIISHTTDLISCLAIFTLLRQRNIHLILLITRSNFRYEFIISNSKNQAQPVIQDQSYCSIQLIYQALAAIQDLSYVFNRPGVDGAFYKHLCKKVICSFNHPFAHNLQYIINPKLLELGSWNFERNSTPQKVSHVRSHMSGVTCQMSCVRFHKYTFFFLIKWWSQFVEGLLSTGPTLHIVSS